MIRSLVPEVDALTQVLPTERLTASGMPTRDLRDSLRHFSDIRSGFTVLAAWAQSFGVVIAAAIVGTWWSYLLAFVLMARGHVCLSILAHEAAHRMLFHRRSINDTVGRWLVAYPTLLPMKAYRRGHFAHHRDEMGPNEPDLALYSGYPAPRDSWRRKLTRDAFGISAYKIFRGLLRAVRSGQREAQQILLVQSVLLVASIIFLSPIAYVVWILSWATLWRVSNRLRAIAEHGGMERSDDRRRTTHVIRQSRLARFWMVPYNTGWHLAHHVDAAVPWRKLPELHGELVGAGWVTEQIEYESYWAFWRAASSGLPR